MFPLNRRADLQVEVGYYYRGRCTHSSFSGISSFQQERAHLSYQFRKKEKKGVQTLTTN